MLSLGEGLAMMSNRAVLKGTFRLSIVAAVLAGAYTAFEGWQRNVKDYGFRQQMIKLRRRSCLPACTSCLAFKAVVFIGFFNHLCS
jgi:hypothetical protein